MSIHKSTPKHHNHTSTIKPGQFIVHSYARYVAGVVVSRATARGGRVVGYTVRQADGKHSFIPAGDAILMEAA